MEAFIDNVILGTISAWWIKAVAASGLSERAIFVMMMYLTSELVYFLMALAYFVLWRYDLFLQYRIQQSAKVPQKDLVLRCVFEVFIRSALARMPILYFLYDVFKYFGMEITAPLPGIRSILATYAVSLVFNDTVFYWGHRLLHHPWFYKPFHKKHHEFKVNIGLNSEYAHPIEVGVCDVFPSIGACMFMGSHFLVLQSWMFIRIWESTAAHSGYALPFCPWSRIPGFNGPQVHDFHHSHNIGSFGAMTRFWDALMGTDAAYKAYVSKNPNPCIPVKC